MSKWKAKLEKRWLQTGFWWRVHCKCTGDFGGKDDLSFRFNKKSPATMFVRDVRRGRTDPLERKS